MGWKRLSTALILSIILQSIEKNKPYLKKLLKKEGIIFKSFVFNGTKKAIKTLFSALTPVFDPKKDDIIRRYNILYIIHFGLR